MKILIRVLLAIAIILAGYLITFAIINKYEDTKADQKLAEQSRQAEANAKAEQAQLSITKEAEARYNALVGECQKGLSAYNQLPAIIKSRVAAPVCPTVQ